MTRAGTVRMTRTPAPEVNYVGLLADVKTAIIAAQRAAVRAVNRELVSLYWEIGRLIVERQRGQTWGKAIVERLAHDLRVEFPGLRGFSSPNLWRTRQMYLEYAEDPILSTLSREIGWSQNVAILDSCKNRLERQFYLTQARDRGWTHAMLREQIEGRAYQATLSAQHNFERTISISRQAHARLAVRDEYVFDFLKLGEEHDERELERALIARIERFLRAMGGVFAFVGSQFRLEVDGREFFVDLLLFHRRMRCLVAVELKVGEFEPEYVGKMQFYLTALDRLHRHPGEAAPIGIILCRDKRRTIVEYALHDARRPIGVASYRRTRRLPRELRDELPSARELARLIGPNEAASKG
jgi:predicted nuclease of restriction endonuclease-like (RecB) superfamily